MESKNKKIVKNKSFLTVNAHSSELKLAQIASIEHLKKVLLQNYSRKNFLVMNIPSAQVKGIKLRK